MATAYKIIKKIGEGGMGFVCLAIQEPLGRPVAMKFMSTEMTEPIHIQRFEREVEASIRISHPNVIKIMERGIQDGQHYYVMEYLEEYETLHDLIRARGRFAWAEMVPVAVQFLSALQCCHENRLVHRDVKPRNIMVSRQGHVKVMDFGLVKSCDRTVLTQPGKCMGTPSYMAPEMFLSDEITASADIFAAGAIVYEMVTGVRAFDGQDLREIATQIVKGAPLPLAHHDPELARYQPLIDRFLEKEPGKRYGSAAAAAHDIKSTVGSPAGGPRRRATRSTRPLLAVPPPPPRSHAGIVAGTVLLAVLAGAAWHFDRGRLPGPPPPPASPALISLEIGNGCDRVWYTASTLNEVSGTVTLSREGSSPVTHPIRLLPGRPVAVAGLSPGTAYRYELRAPGAAARGTFATRPLVEAARDVARGLEQARLDQIARRIRLQYNNLRMEEKRSEKALAPFRDSNLASLRRSFASADLPRSLEVFEPVATAFFDDRTGPAEVKVHLYALVQELRDLEDLTRYYRIAFAPVSPRLQAASYGQSPSPHLPRPRALLAAVWIPRTFEADRARFIAVDSRLRPGTINPRFDAPTRFLAMERAEIASDAAYAFAGKDAWDATAFQTRSPLALPANTREVELVMMFERTDPANYLRVYLRRGQGAEVLVAVLRPVKGSPHRVYHRVDPRVLAPGPFHLRLDLRYDPEGNAIEQQARVGYFALTVP